MRRWLAISTCLAAALPAQACPLPAPALQDGAVQVAWKVDNGQPIRVGQHFVLDLQLCPLDAVLLRVDAVMPEHGHGMNYRPSLATIGNGRWRAEGLLFQMPGAWELRLDVQTPDGTVRLRETFLVP